MKEILTYSVYYRYCNFLIDIDLIYINTYFYQIHVWRTKTLFLVFLRHGFGKFQSDKISRSCTRCENMTAFALGLRVVANLELTILIGYVFVSVTETCRRFHIFLETIGNFQIDRWLSEEV